MNVSKVLQGASRLPLTSKRGNKDFYKGSRQAFVPGGGHRTGPPGKHLVKGDAKFRILDDKVRYYVGPGIEALESTELRPYVSALAGYKKEKDTQNSTIERLVRTCPRPSRFSSRNPSIPFGPNATHLPLTVQRARSPFAPPLEEDAEACLRTITIDKHDTKAFSKWYRALTHEERQRVVAEQRRRWYESQVEGLARSQEASAASTGESEQSL